MGRRKKPAFGLWTGQVWSLELLKWQWPADLGNVGNFVHVVAVRVGTRVLSPDTGYHPESFDFLQVINI